MDKFIDSPWFLRITALLLAIILFYTVQSEDGATNGKSSGEQVDIIRDVPVDVYYDNENLVVTGVPETVDVTVEGPINIVQTMKLLKDFSVIVDLRTLTMGKHTVQIKHENISEKLQVRIDPASIDVVIEEKVTETLPVEAELNKRQLAENFNVTNMEVIPSTVEVTGAKSVIESISFVKATVSGEEGINKSFEQEAKVRILDRDLNKLDVTIVPENVIVKVDVVENNKEVPIVLKAVGSPLDGVVIESLSTEQNKIVMYGPSQVLDEINEQLVEVDISKVDKNGTLDIDIPIPKGVSELSFSKIKAEVKVKVEKPDKEDEKIKEEDEASSEETDIATASEQELEEKENKEKEQNEEIEEVEDEEIIEDQDATKTMDFKNIKVLVTGLDKKFTNTFLQPESGLITLTVTAETDIVDELSLDDFTLSIDASATEVEGEQAYPVKVKGPKNIKWLLSQSEVKMMVELA